MLNPPNSKTKARLGSMKHDAATKLITAHLFPKPTLEAGLRCKLTCGVVIKLITSAAKHNPMAQDIFSFYGLLIFPILHSAHHVATSFQP